MTDDGPGQPSRSRTTRSPGPADSGSSSRSEGFLRENSLSIAFFLLFVVCLVGQGVSGWYDYNQVEAAGHQPTVGFANYLTTGTFLNGAFSNWNAALLQLAVLVIFAKWFYQKGASISHADIGRKSQRRVGNSGRHSFRQRAGEILNDNSLTLALFASFAIVFLLHLLAGTEQYNLQLSAQGQPSLSPFEYLWSSDFWFSTFQTWEAEFFAMGLFVVMTIYLRQKGSVESKPVGAGDTETGVRER